MPAGRTSATTTVWARRRWPVPYQWANGTPITNCLECHQNGATMVSNGHNKHLNNGYTSAPCTDCHTAATASATHLNRSLNVDTAKVTLSGAVAGAVALGTVNGTCTTASCHNTAVASTAWNGGQLACNSCHGNGSGQSMSGSHDPHLIFGKPCTACHASVTDTTHITAAGAPW